MNEILTVKHLNKTYMRTTVVAGQSPTIVAVNDLSFSLQEGEIFGITGPSNAGKTTTLHLLATLAKPASGSVIIGGIDATAEPAKIRRKIGFMSGDITPDDIYTPNQLFRYFSNLYNIDPSVAKGRGVRMLEELNILHLADKRLENVPRSVLQKVCLTCSLLHNPDLLILDEPTAGMDILDTRLVAEFLLHLKAAKKTIVLTTSDLTLMRTVCDRTGLLMDGSLHTFADVDTLENKFIELYNNAKEVEHNV